MSDVLNPSAPSGAARISVVVTVQNDAPGLERSLAGLERQGTLLEVIVVDRGSIDHSMAAAARWGARVVEAGNISPAEARNIGLRRSSGDAVLFLDTKSIPCPGWARALSGPIIDGKTLATKGTQRTRQSAAPARLAQLQHERRWSHHEGTLSFLDDYCVGVHREGFLEAGGFAEDASDVAIEHQRTSQRICESGRALFVPQAVIERHYDERWLGALRRAYRVGKQSGQLLRCRPRRFGAALRWSLHDLLQIPLIVAATLLCCVGLFAPLYLAAGLFVAMAPFWSQLLLLKRGVDQFAPDFFFLGAPLVIARSWALSCGAIHGLLPPRRKRAKQRARAPQQGSQVIPQQAPVQSPFPQQPNVVEAQPQNLARQPRRSLLDPAAVVQRKQTQANEPQAAATGYPMTSDQLRQDRDDVVVEEDRELDFTP
ncbi:MAG: glycosyltransferase [Planctomycetota bacterium]